MESANAPPHACYLHLLFPPNEPGTHDREVQRMRLRISQNNALLPTLCNGVCAHLVKIIQQRSIFIHYFSGSRPVVHDKTTHMYDTFDGRSHQRFEKSLSGNDRRCKLDVFPTARCCSKMKHRINSVECGVEIVVCPKVSTKYLDREIRPRLRRVLSYLQIFSSEAINETRGLIHFVQRYGLLLA